VYSGGVNFPVFSYKYSAPSLCTASQSVREFGGDLNAVAWLDSTTLQGNYET